MSARACGSVASGLSRANTRSDAPLSVFRASRTSGAHSSARVAQKGAKWKAGGMTPTTVYGSPANDHGLAPQMFLVGAEHASDGRLNAEQRQDVGREVQRVQLFCPIRSRQIRR